MAATVPYTAQTYLVTATLAQNMYVETMIIVLIQLRTYFSQDAVPHGHARTYSVLAVGLA